MYCKARLRQLESQQPQQRMCTSLLAVDPNPVLEGVGRFAPSNMGGGRAFGGMECFRVGQNGVGGRSGWDWASEPYLGCLDLPQLNSGSAF